MFDKGYEVAGWTIDDLLHQGSMATTYRVHRGNEATPHVLKLLFVRDPSFQERLRRAADVLVSVRHPNLVPVVGLVEHEGMQGIVSRYIDGTDLATWASAEQRPLPEVIKVFRQLTLGLRAAHDHGLVHRNLKPGKVLIDLTGRAHLHDFMLGKVVSTDPDKAVTQLGTTFGTPQYMAPEQFRGAAGVDERADLFSLGCLLFELVAGRRAFDGQGLMEIYQQVSHGEREDLTEVRVDVPPALEQLVADLTRPDPAQRPASAQEVIARLGQPELRALISPSHSTATPVSALTTDHPSSSPESRPAAPRARVSRSEPSPSVPQAARAILDDREQQALGAPRVMASAPPLRREDGPVPEDLSEASAPSIITFTQFDSAESSPEPSDDRKVPGPFHRADPSSPSIRPVHVAVLMGLVFIVSLLAGMWMASG